MALVETVSQRHPESNAGCIWRWSFSWLNPLISQSGKKGSLDHDDLYEVKTSETTEVTMQRFEAALAKSKSSPDGQVNVKRALIIMARRDCIITGMLKLVNTTVQVLPFILLRKFLQWQKEDGEKKWGLIYVLAIFLCMATKAISENIYFHRAMMTSIQVRTALMSVLFRKTLQLSLHARQTFSTGEVVNLMQIWTMRLEEFFAMKMHILWDGAVQIICYISIAVWLVGPSAIGGILIMFPLATLQGKVMKKVGKTRIQAAKWADARVRMVTEVFTGIRAIKSYSWEKPWGAEVERLRGNELKGLRVLALLSGVMRAFMSTSPQLILLVVFVLYGIIFSEKMEADVVFTTLAVFQNVRMALMFYPMALAGLVDARQSIQRIETFLNAGEVLPPPNDDTVAIESEKGQVSVRGATVSYRRHGEVQSRLGFDPPPKKVKKSKCATAKVGLEEGSTEDKLEVAENGAAPVERIEVLRNVTFDVSPGSLVTVVGPVGSGKSSLVAAVLGELVTLEGSVKSRGRVAYAPQQPWITNASVRDNILFERPYDEARYEWVLDACCLRTDMEQLPGGDDTEIGERGITLSGGQKQRVSLARTLYTDADIYVFDDPLSALDAETASAVFKNCILSPALAKKTRLLITHARFTLLSSDQVVVLEHDADGCGRLASVGAPEMVRQLSDKVVGQDDDVEEVKLEDAKVNVTAVDKAPLVKKPRASLTSVETKATGNVKGAVYWGYFKAVGSVFLCIGAVFTNLTSVLVQSGSVFWLSLWTDGRLDHLGFEDAHYCTGYGLLAVVGLVSSFLSAFTIIVLGNRASHKLHTDLFSTVLHAPLAFFDTTPLGRILNRFSHDVEGMDTKLPENLSMLIVCSLTVFSMLLSIAVAVPMAAVGVPALVMAYFYVLQRFRVANREIKRLDSVALSPVFAHFQQSLGGISTIRAYGASSTFIASMMSRINHHTRSHYCMKSMNRWLSVRLELLGSFVLLVTGLMAVFGQGVSPGLAGVAMVYGLQCTGTMNWTVRTLGETEASMNCAERILQYISDTPAEAAQHVQGTLASWPESGMLSFESVSLRYRPELPLVLSNLSFTIDASWRVGVVGRTGCGKSTLLLAVMRLVELESGSISIAGVKTSSVGLTDLRSKLAVIPQDPVLWTGSLRKNLDPFGSYSDAQVWGALNAVGQQEPLEQRFPGVPLGGIDVAEFGENFSHGQRQLFCLARAMLKDSKLVLMDEATSALDETTDALVQRAVRDLFAKATMLIVAHRLRTIAAADRILVLNEGQRVEFDAPNVLLATEGSHFSALVDELGPQEKQLVRERANSAARKDSGVTNDKLLSI